MVGYDSAFFSRACFKVAHLFNSSEGIYSLPAAFQRSMNPLTSRSRFGSSGGGKQLRLVCYSFRCVRIHTLWNKLLHVCFLRQSRLFQEPPCTWHWPIGFIRCFSPRGLALSCWKLLILSMGVCTSLFLRRPAKVLLAANVASRWLSSGHYICTSPSDRTCPRGANYFIAPRTEGNSPNYLKDSEAAGLNAQRSQCEDVYVTPALHNLGLFVQWLEVSADASQPGRGGLVHGINRLLPSVLSNTGHVISTGTQNHCCVALTAKAVYLEKIVLFHVLQPARHRAGSWRWGVHRRRTKGTFSLTFELFGPWRKNQTTRMISFPV